MAINYRNINYGLPGRYTKLPIRKVSTKKTNYPKCLFRSVELFNPEPMPYQKDLFKPCTVARLVDIPRRLSDGFMTIDDMTAPKQRGIILHRDRYDWSNVKDMLSNQNERLAAEENYIKKAKSLKKLTEQKPKPFAYNLLLEGENMLPGFSQERSENKRDKNSHFVEEDSFRHPAPTMITNFSPTSDALETVDLQQPVSMGVHQIKLKMRQFGGDGASSAPVHSTHTNIDSNQRMYIPPDARDSFGRLPPINNKQKESESNIFTPTNSLPDYEAAFRQSERFNRPNVRLNEYVVDGVPVKFIERADIQGELKCLKQLALPTTARDLFIGRGIHLPSTHATKNPRLRYIDDNSNPLSQMTNSLKIDTPGGGSVTINSKAPSTTKLAPDITPTIDDQPDVGQISGEENPLENATDIARDLNFEDVFNLLDPNVEGLVDSIKFADYVNGIDALSLDEKMFIAASMNFTEKLTSAQVDVILQSIKIICNSSRTIRDHFITVDDAKMKLLFPTLLTFLDQSQSRGKATFHEFLITSLNLTLTVDACAEIYTSFREQIASNESIDNEDIPPSHILLFVPFLIHMTEPK